MGSMAWTGSSAIITLFGGGTGTNLLYWWQAEDAKEWHQQLVATNLSEYGWPAIAWTGTAVVIAAIDGGGDLYYWWQAAYTTEWHQQLVATGLAPATPAAIAWTGNAVVIAAVDSSGNILYWWQAAYTTEWHQQVVGEAGLKTIFPGQNPSIYVPPVAIAATESFVGIVAVDTNGNLNFWQQAIGTSPWKQTIVPPPDPNNPFMNPDIASTGSSIVITAVDASGNLYFDNQDDFGDLWTPGLVASPQGNARYALPKIAWNAPPTPSSPFAGSFGVLNSIIIACIDTEHNVDYWQGPAETSPAVQTVANAGGDGGYSFPAIAWTGNSAIVAALTGSGELNFWWQAAGSADWHQETVANL
jgi:hypothetical protein